MCRLRNGDLGIPSSLPGVIEECVGKITLELKRCPAPFQGTGTQFCLRIGLDTVPLSLMVKCSARASSGWAAFVD